MRILVLGGTAFLSAEMARQALAAGPRRHLPGARDGFRPARRRHLAAGGPLGRRRRVYSRQRGRRLRRRVGRRRRRVAGPRPGAGGARGAGGSARHWTFISSCSVYADHSVAGADEDAAVLAPLAPGTELSAENYGEAKAAIEHWTAELAGDRAHICRAGLDRRPGRRLGPLRVLAGPLRPGRGSGPGPGHPRGRHADHRRPGPRGLDPHSRRKRDHRGAERRGGAGALCRLPRGVAPARRIFRRGGRRPGRLAGVPRGELLGRSGLAALVAAAGPRRLRDPQQRRCPGRRSEHPALDGHAAGHPGG